MASFSLKVGNSIYKEQQPTPSFGMLTFSKKGLNHGEHSQSCMDGILIYSWEQSKNSQHAA